MKHGFSVASFVAAAAMATLFDSAAWAAQASGPVEIHSPHAGTVTSPPSSHAAIWEQGQAIDIAAAGGTAVYFRAGGPSVHAVVKPAAPGSYYFPNACTAWNENNDGSGLQLRLAVYSANELVGYARYVHLSNIQVSPEQTILPGALLGFVQGGPGGSCSSGPHTHVEVSGASMWPEWYDFPQNSAISANAPLVRIHVHSGEGYWVDPQCGSDFAPGTAAQPFRTINFALFIAAPGSTIHLYDGVYSQASGQSFPVVMKDDISLVGAAGCVCAGGCGATEPILDGLNNVPVLIEFDPTHSFPSSAIRGLTFRNATRGIDIRPTTGNHAPLIEQNKFGSLSTGIHVQSDGTLAPVIRDNTFTAGTGIYVNGAPTGGLTQVLGNYLQSSGINISGFSGEIECMNNSIQGASTGITVSGCCPWAAWNPASRIEGNLITGGAYGIHINQVAGVTLRGNTCIGGSRGIFLDWTAHDSVVTSNALEGNSVGLYIHSSVQRAVIEDNAIRNNTGNGVRDDSFQGSRYSRNIIVDNAGHGIFLAPTNPPTTTLSKIVQNTITGNAGNGIFTNVTSTYPPYVNSCIIWGNGGCDIAGLSAGQYCYSLIGTCGSPACSNISADPLFMDAANGDYCLRLSSPCVNAGDPALPPDCDGSRADIGALALHCGPCGGFSYFCAGDGSGVACPCSNNNNDGSLGVAGCANSSFASGCRITAGGSYPDAVTILVENAKPSQFGIVLRGTDSFGGAQILDGLLCTSGNTARSDPILTNAFGAAESGPLPQGPPGAQWNYQFWYRDSGLCAGSNLSNAVGITW